MGIPIFLSYPKPHMKIQQTFIECVIKYLEERGLEGHTLGQSDYDIDAPLASIRRMMLEANGVLVIAFRRYWIEKGVENDGTDTAKGKTRDVSGKWMTSPWCHIESAMAFQLALPLLILRENGVYPDGVLQHGVIGTYMPEFDLATGCDEYFKSPEWRQLIAQWEGRVRKIRETKGTPSLYGV